MKKDLEHIIEKRKDFFFKKYELKKLKTLKTFNNVFKFSQKKKQKIVNLKFVKKKILSLNHFVDKEPVNTDNSVIKPTNAFFHFLNSYYRLIFVYYFYNFYILKSYHYYYLNII